MKLLVLALVAVSIHANAEPKIAVFNNPDLGILYQGEWVEWDYEAAVDGRYAADQYDISLVGSVSAIELDDAGNYLYHVLTKYEYSEQSYTGDPVLLRTAEKQVGIQVGAAVVIDGAYLESGLMEFKDRMTGETTALLAPILVLRSMTTR